MDLLACATEDPRVAVLEPNDAPARLRRRHQQVVDRALALRMAARALAHAEFFAAVGDERDNAGSDERVVEDDIGSAYQPLCFGRQQVGIPGPAPTSQISPGAIRSDMGKFLREQTGDSGAA